MARIGNGDCPEGKFVDELQWTVRILSYSIAIVIPFTSKIRHASEISDGNARYDQ
jgi:hypothetical protein